MLPVYSMWGGGREGRRKVREKKREARRWEEKERQIQQDKEKEKEEDMGWHGALADRLLLSERLQCVHYPAPDMTFRVLNEEQRCAQPHNFYRKSNSMLVQVGLQCCIFTACGQKIPVAW